MRACEAFVAVQVLAGRKISATARAEISVRFVGGRAQRLIVWLVISLRVPPNCATPLVFHHHFELLRYLSIEASLDKP